MKILFIVITTTILIIISISCYAFRCDNEIIGRWDTADSVINKCGKPSKTEYANEQINGQLQRVEK